MLYILYTRPGNLRSEIRGNLMQIRLWDNNLKVRLIGEGLFNMLFGCTFRL